jgi:hypothetical protein
MRAFIPPFQRRLQAVRAVVQDLPAWSAWLLFGALAVGVMLRGYQFAIDSSLWLDELAIANNLAERSLWSLLREPLAYAQVAPPGFITFEKVMYELFGPNDRALRLYSFLAGTAALGAMSVVALRIGLRESAWAAVLVLALGGPFIFQSAQVKPYSGDVFFALALVAIALRLGARSDARLAWPIALGVIAPWFSFAASFTVAGVGVLLMLSPERRRYAPLVALWALSVVVALLYAESLVDPVTAASMQQFWSLNGVGFPSGSSAVVPWSLGQLQAHLWSELGLRGVAFWLGIAGVGAVLLGWRNRFALGVVAAPMLVAFAAALLRRYPLGSRLSHWIAALLILLVLAGAVESVRLLQRLRLGALAPVPGALVAVLPMLSFAASPPPYRVEHVQPVLAEIGRRTKPGDWLYVYPGAWHAYKYYGRLTGIAASRVVYGLCPRASLRDALMPLDGLHGGRVWALFTHVTTPNERHLVLDYLDHVGVRRESVWSTQPYVAASSSVDAHLYELRARTAAVSWRTYPVVVRRAGPNEHSLCEVGLVPWRNLERRIERAGELQRH